MAIHYSSHQGVEATEVNLHRRMKLVIAAIVGLLVLILVLKVV